MVVLRPGLVFVLVLLVRLMFLCNVNNVEPSSWTRPAQAGPATSRVSLGQRMTAEAEWSSSSQSGQASKTLTTSSSGAEQEQ